MPRFIIPAALGACAVFGLAASADAAGYDASNSNPRVVVKATYAELRSPKGAQAVALRIRVAADHVCGVDVNPILRQSDDFWHCREAAIDGAIRGLDAPLLSAALGRSSTVLARADH